ncbi:MAG: small, acid-soluble spore protein, alpha/beta type [Eubacteriales bacterium]|nr:small, acid-soluble spore protein, alpha/beta type [Eubacteriales bacterium]
MKKEKEVEAYLNGELSPEEMLKYEIAEELGVLDKVLETGWKSLSAKETGRIGGLMTRRKKSMVAEQE